MTRRRRAVITGIGIFCGAGKDIPSFTDSLINGKSAIAELELFDASRFHSRIGAEIRNYRASDYFAPSLARKLSRADQFAMIAAGEAVSDSALSNCRISSETGVCVGAGAAGMYQGEFWLKAQIEGKKASPGLLRGILPDSTATLLAKNFRFRGYQGTVTTACSSSSTAIGMAAEMISRGELKTVLAGGTDALSLLTFAGFNSLRVVDPQPCSPFSIGRQGITLGEGAAFFMLEDEESAIARGTRIYGAISGYAVAAEAFHMTAPEPDGHNAARVMLNALSSAGLSAGDVGWVNAHGTGTPMNDVVESKAARLVFGENVMNVPLVSTKGMTGHCLGAAGAIEAVATIIALDRKIIPQTLNFRGNDPECPLEYRHAGKTVSDSKVAISNSFAFGGNITSLVLER